MFSVKPVGAAYLLDTDQLVLFIYAQVIIVFILIKFDVITSILHIKSSYLPSTSFSSAWKGLGLGEMEVKFQDVWTEK